MYKRALYQLYLLFQNFHFHYYILHGRVRSTISFDGEIESSILNEANFKFIFYPRHNYAINRKIYHNLSFPP